MIRYHKTDPPTSPHGRPSMGGRLNGSNFWEFQSWTRPAILSERCLIVWGKETPPIYPPRFEPKDDIRYLERHNCWSLGFRIDNEGIFLKMSMAFCSQT